MVAQILKVQIPNAILGIRNWACILTVDLQEPNSWLAATWQNTVPLQNTLLAFSRPVIPLEWGLRAVAPQSISHLSVLYSPGSPLSQGGEANKARGITLRGLKVFGHSAKLHMAL